MYRLKVSFGQAKHKIEAKVVVKKSVSKVGLRLDLSVQTPVESEDH